MAKLENWGQDGLKIPMPNFNAMRSDTVVRVRDGIWTLVSSQTPIDENGKPRRSVKRMTFLKVQKAR